MLDAGVTTVLSKLQEVASAEVTTLLKVDDQIRDLRRVLCYLQAEIRCADQQRRSRASEVLQLWARESREVAFTVEDAIDEFHLKVEAFQVKVKWRRTWYRTAAVLLNGIAMQIFVRHGLSREITKIQDRIKEINQIKETYKIATTSSEPWSPLINDDIVWDIKDDRTEFREKDFGLLKKLILNTGDQLSSHRAIISIVGDSGTGKTRLARKLYNDHEISQKFDVFSWICLPPHIRFDQYVGMVADQIRHQVEPGDGGSGCMDPAASSRQTCRSDTLKKLLEGRKYLIVLDGLVDTVNFNSLLVQLPSNNTGSRIIITTQLLAKEIRHADPKMTFITLNTLNTTQTSDLLLDRVLGADGLLRDRSTSQMMPGVTPWGSGTGFNPPSRASPQDGGNKLKKDFSERIYNITRGLPLAVIVLGGVLRSRAYPSEWEDVFAQKLETPMGEAKALRCLWLLAFEDLPNHLKSCFLYLATASENILLDADRLVRLWIAEGFVAPSAGQTLEEVGLGYLKQLVCRGLVELVERDARGGGVKSVVVHSLLHSFVKAEAEESSFVKIHHHASVVNPGTVRRLAIHNFVDSYVDIPDRFPKLRSLLCDLLEKEEVVEEEKEEEQDDDGERCADSFDLAAEWLLRACGASVVDGPAAAASSRKKKLHQLSFVRSSRFLRVIDLYGLLLERVPDEIADIIHLRYLGIRSCRKLRRLPESISKLDNLQTLDVRKTPVDSVTDELWELPGLRHVLADTLQLPGCPRPRAHLKQLQTLMVAVAPTGLAWSFNNRRSCPLNYMTYLRSLEVFSIPDNTDVVAAILLALQSMVFLVSLSLSGSLVPSGVFTNQALRRLETLALHGNLDPPPRSWSDQFILPNLRKLTLCRSGLRDLAQEFVDKVAALPNLAEMELLDGSYGHKDLLLFEGGFPSLRNLKLNNLAALEMLKLASGSAPDLTIITHYGSSSNFKILDDRRTPELEDAMAINNVLPPPLNNPRDWNFPVVEATSNGGNRSSISAPRPASVKPRSRPIMGREMPPPEMS